jgi:hypothetical protein
MRASAWLGPTSRRSSGCYWTNHNIRPTPRIHFRTSKPRAGQLTIAFPFPSFTELLKAGPQHGFKTATHAPTTDDSDIGDGELWLPTPICSFGGNHRDLIQPLDCRWP